MVSLGLVDTGHFDGSRKIAARLEHEPGDASVEAVIPSGLAEFGKELEGLLGKP